MGNKILLLLLSAVAVSAWSPYYPGRPMRFTRFAPPPPHLGPPGPPVQHLGPPGAPVHHFGPPGPPVPHLGHLHQRPRPPQKIPVEQPELEKPQWDRPKRGHDYHDHDHDHKPTSGVTGPVHTFVKTDKNANYKWGVRHHVGDKYAS